MIIKKIVKHIVAKCFGKGIKELKNTDHYSTISFDIFDTLVCRTCDKPEKVFEIGKVQLAIEDWKKQSILMLIILLFWILMTF